MFFKGKVLSTTSMNMVYSEDKLNERFFDPFTQPYS